MGDAELVLIFFILHLLAAPMIYSCCPPQTFPPWPRTQIIFLTRHSLSSTSSWPVQYDEWRRCHQYSYCWVRRGRRRINQRSLILASLFRLWRWGMAGVLSDPLLHELGHLSQSKPWSQRCYSQEGWAQPDCLHCVLLSLQVEMCLVEEVALASWESGEGAQDDRVSCREDDGENPWPWFSSDQPCKEERED